ncbi:MAG: glycerol-3-phosphate 1-O-acyltransferase PlsY [Clostridia bacterium]|nr:glycerol-3-phosphate 1-O-acyltransferase PlsY [Clostridia bacterium]
MYYSFFYFIESHWLQVFAVALISYLIGSVCFSIIFTKLFKNGEDIRNLGSKNAGFTNVLRSVGGWPAIFTMLGDSFKCIVAIVISRYIFIAADYFSLQYISYLSGLFCSLGHVFPCWYKFKGGKSVLVSAAVIFMTDWQVLLVLLCIFLISLHIFKIMSLSSIIAAISYPCLNAAVCLLRQNFLRYAFPEYYLIYSTCFCLILAGIVLLKHKSNIIRLLNGEEKKISIHKKDS